MIKKYTPDMFCDFCHGELPQIEHALENGEKAVLYLQGKSKHEDVKSKYPRLCQACARKLDELVDHIHERERDRETIMRVNKALNEARRIKLGSKG